MGIKKKKLNFSLDWYIYFQISFHNILLWCNCAILTLTSTAKEKKWGHCLVKEMSFFSFLHCIIWFFINKVYYAIKKKI